MKTILIRIYGFIIVIKNHILWKMQATHVKKLTGSSHATAFHSKSRIIVIAPHADDDLIGCHCLISNHRHIITIIYCNYLGCNQSEKNRIVREKEIIAYSQDQGCNLIISSPQTIHKDLEKAIGLLKPEYVFLPSYVDWHDEHRLINDIFVSIVPPNPIKVGWYHVSLPIPEPFVTAYSAMSKVEHREKWEAMIKYYQSQLHMDLTRFKYIEKLSRSGNLYGETYLIMDFDDYCLMMEQLALLSYEKFQSLKTTLGNIKKMYVETSNIYQLIRRTYASNT